MDTQNSVLSFASQTYEKFRKYEGADQIATRRALEILGSLILEKRPKNIVEIGSGIGTITYFTFMITKTIYEIGEYIAYEKVLWCQEKFRENIVEKVSKSRVKLISDFKNFDLTNSTQLIIIDDKIDSSDYQVILSKASPNFDIFIEGHRFPQRLETIRLLKKNRFKFKYRGFTGSSNSYKGAAVFHVDKTKHNFIVYISIIGLWVKILMLYMVVRSFRSKISLRKIFGVA